MHCGVFSGLPLPDCMLLPHSHMGMMQTVRFLQYGCVQRRVHGCRIQTSTLSQPRQHRREGIETGCLCMYPAGVHKASSHAINLITLKQACHENPEWPATPHHHPLAKGYHNALEWHCTSMAAAPAGAAASGAAVASPEAAGAAALPPSPAAASAAGAAAAAGGLGCRSRCSASPTFKHIRPQAQQFHGVWMALALGSVCRAADFHGMSHKLTGRSLPLG